MDNVLEQVHKFVNKEHVIMHQVISFQQIYVINI